MLGYERPITLRVDFAEKTLRVSRQERVARRGWRRLFGKYEDRDVVFGVYRDPSMKLEITRAMNRPGTCQFNFDGLSPEAFLGMRTTD